MPARASLYGLLKILAVALLILLAVFVSLTATAAALYPGGTWCDKSSPGFDLAQNFLCDLLHERALNGTANPGATLARTGMLSLAVALVPFWLGVAELVRARPVLASATRAFGVISALGTALVSLNPSDRFAALHQTAVLGTTVSALAAALSGCVGLYLAPGGRGLATLGGLSLVLAGIDGFLYLRQVFSPVACATLLPVVQKLAGLLVLAWMLAVAARLSRRPTAASPTRSRAR